MSGKLNQKLKFLQFREIIGTQMEWRQGEGGGPKPFGVSHLSVNVLCKYNLIIGMRLQQYQEN